MPLAQIVILAGPVLLIAPAHPMRTEQAMAAGASFLMARQNADGAWYSETYGPFKDGASLTPSVLLALRAAPASPQREAACRRAENYLMRFARPDGSIEPGRYGFSYPIYTAATAILALSAKDPSPSAKARQSRAAWLAYLRARQLTEALGWEPGDKAYGAWGFAAGLPRKPGPGEPLPPLTESNLSATVFALQALRAAQISSDDPAVRAALVFVRRCQNYSDTPSRFDDGGFFFIYDDPVRNKAGVAGTDSAGQPRFASYGSMTADGLRALLLGGQPQDRSRIDTARRWLARNFCADRHPGVYPATRETNRSAVYFYYSRSVAQAMQMLRLQPASGAWPTVDSAKQLAEALLARQRPDGSWANAAVAVREDDPLVATALAMQALAACRSALLEAGETAP